MASFQDKIDWYGFTDDDAPLEVIGDEPNETNEYKEYPAQDGSFIDSIAFGNKKAPSNELILTDDWTIAAGDVKLGGVNEVDGESFALMELNINTNAGELPAISAAGQQVQDDAETARYYALPAETVKNEETAQILWSAFTLTGEGCHLQSANYKASILLPVKSKNGTPRTFGVAQGVIECQVTITQCGNTAPTLAAGQNWQISQRLKSSNPDSDVPTWTATLRRFLTKTVPSDSSSST
ncbi:MAG: hypothetical protein IKO72_12295 [Kiritimatiellae bacterium]|nr:hypothetical protein [Kiritimatiellia bacterium]